MKAYRELRIMKGIDNLLEQAVESVPLALPLLEVNVGKLPCHPAGFCPQVAIGAVKAGHDVVLQEPLQMILVRSLQNTLAQVLVYAHSSKQGMTLCTKSPSRWSL